MNHPLANPLAKDRVVVVTGAGRGLGRAHALAFARAGARVLVNDLGVALDGADGGETPAAQVAGEIRAAGGEAAVSTDDIADTTGAANLVHTALERWGRLDTLVNNAGFLRDRMLVNLDEDDWDAVVRVHLRGHFLPMRQAAAHWRAETKSGRRPEAARIVNTSSGAGLLGAVGQGNYTAAKAGIAALTLVAAEEFARYGVQVNAIAPAARTRMTEGTFAESMAAPAEDDAFDAMAPENVSPLVVYLGSPASHGITGRVFEAEGGRITVMDGWRRAATTDKAARWDPAELDAPLRALLSKSPDPEPVYGAQPPE
ncbi:SDR family oxidoreductase [Streptomyces sp. NPDC048172]|uniref:SDR family oxidoreductase n=1 Tax=Streptomyces sp. NPDC048172 TaxID=3365505 RepID=UPI00371003E3